MNNFQDELLNLLEKNSENIEIFINEMRSKKEEPEKEEPEKEEPKKEEPKKEEPKKEEPKKEEPYIENYTYLGTVHYELLKSSFNLYVSTNEIHFNSYYNLNLKVDQAGVWGFGHPTLTDYNSDKLTALSQVRLFKNELTDKAKELIVDARFIFSATGFDGNSWTSQPSLSWISLDNNYNIQIIENNSNLKGRYVLAELVTN